MYMTSLLIRVQVGEPEFGSTPKGRFAGSGLFRLRAALPLSKLILAASKPVSVEVFSQTQALS
jgi:hypothetical protein